MEEQALDWVESRWQRVESLPAVDEGFLEEGLAEHPLPPRWREIAATLDLFSLVNFLARPAAGPRHTDVLARIDRTLAWLGV